MRNCVHFSAELRAAGEGVRGGGQPDKDRPDDWAEDVEHDSHERRRVHEKQRLQVLLVLAVEGAESGPKPAHGRLVVGVEAAVEVHESVIAFHELIQSMQKVSEGQDDSERRQTTSATTLTVEIASN
jgi:hypothetical protein